MCNSPRDLESHAVRTTFQQAVIENPTHQEIQNPAKPFRRLELERRTITHRSTPPQENGPPNRDDSKKITSNLKIQDRKVSKVQNSIRWDSMEALPPPTALPSKNFFKCCHKVTKKNPYENMSLYKALRKIDPEFIRLLSNKWGFFNVKKECFNMGFVLLIACRDLNPEFIPYGKDLNKFYLLVDDINLIYTQKNNKTAEIIKLLIDRGADINVTGKDKDTPMMIVCRNLAPKLIQLHYRRTDVWGIILDESWLRFDNTENKINFFDVGLEIIKLLLGHGAEVNEINSKGETALMMACRYNNGPQIIKLLLDHDAELNVINSEGETPLLMACRYTDNQESIELLLDHGAELNVINFKRETPLMIACRKSNPEYIKLLLDRGADSYIQYLHAYYLNVIAIKSRLVIDGLQIYGQYSLVDLMKYAHTLSYDFLEILLKQQACDYTFTTKDQKPIGVHRKLFKLRLNQDITKTTDVFFALKNSKEVEVFLKWVYSGVVSAADEKTVREFCSQFGIQGRDFVEKNGFYGFRNDMKKLYEDTDSKDFSIIVGDSVIKVDQIVLLARSQTFRDMFLNVKDDSQQVHDYLELPYAAYNIIIKYLYTGEMDRGLLTPDIIEELNKHYTFFQMNPHEENPDNPYSFIRKLN